MLKCKKGDIVVRTEGRLDKTISSRYNKGVIFEVTRDFISNSREPYSRAPFNAHSSVPSDKWRHATEREKLVYRLGLKNISRKYHEVNGYLNNEIKITVTNLVYFMTGFEHAAIKDRIPEFQIGWSTKIKLEQLLNVCQNQNFSIHPENNKYMINFDLRLFDPASSPIKDTIVTASHSIEDTSKPKYEVGDKVIMTHSANNKYVHTKQGKIGYIIKIKPRHYGNSHFVDFINLHTTDKNEYWVSPNHFIHFESKKSLASIIKTPDGLLQKVDPVHGHDEIKFYNPTKFYDTHGCVINEDSTMEKILSEHIVDDSKRDKIDMTVPLIKVKDY